MWLTLWKFHTVPQKGFSVENKFFFLSRWYGGICISGKLGIFRKLFAAQVPCMAVEEGLYHKKCLEPSWGRGTSANKQQQMWCWVFYWINLSLHSLWKNFHWFVAIRFSFYGCKSICLRFGASGWWWHSSLHVANRAISVGDSGGVFWGLKPFFVLLSSSLPTILTICWFF